MVIKLSNFEIIVPFFFFTCIFYWFPFVSNGFVSGIKFFLLIFLIFLKISYFKYINLKKFFFESGLIFISIVYELIANGTGEFLLIILILMLMYELGCVSQVKNINNILCFMVIVSFIWVFLALFVPGLDYKNNLFLEYEYRDILLSSTGFSIARTSWGISTLLLTLFFLQFNNSKIFKFLLLITCMLCILSTGSRTAIVCFCIALLFLFIFLIKNINLKLLAIFFLFIFSWIIYYYFGAFLRLSNVDDFSNGRLDQYVVLGKIFESNYFLGWYRYGGYSLEIFGYDYSQFHNAWIHTMLNYGIFGSMIIFSWLFYCILNMKYIFCKKYLYLYLILICGLITTLFEPEVIFSYGYHILIFWFILGMLSKYNLANKD